MFENLFDSLKDGAELSKPKKEKVEFLTDPSINHDVYRDVLSRINSIEDERYLYDIIWKSYNVILNNVYNGSNDILYFRNEKFLKILSIVLNNQREHTMKNICTINYIAKCYIECTHPEPDIVCVRILNTICRIVNAHYVNQIVDATGIDNNDALRIVYSLLNGNIDMYSYSNMIEMVCNTAAVLSEQDIIYIIETFNECTRISMFLKVLLDKEFKFEFSNKHIANQFMTLFYGILSIIEEQSHNDIRNIFIRFNEIMDKCTYRFSLRGLLLNKYPRIDFVLTELQQEGIVIY